MRVSWEIIIVSLLITFVERTESARARQNIAKNDICYNVNLKLKNLVVFDMGKYFRQKHPDIDSEMICKSPNIRCCSSEIIHEYQESMSALMQSHLGTEFQSLRDQQQEVLKITGETMKMMESKVYCLSQSPNLLYWFLNHQIDANEDHTKSLNSILIFNKDEIAIQIQRLSEIILKSIKIAGKCDDRVNQSVFPDLEHEFIPTSYEVVIIPRILHRLLKEMGLVMKNIVDISVSKNCLNSIALMDLCAFCRNAISSRSLDFEKTFSNPVCRTYCRNVIRGCFFEHITTAKQLSRLIERLIFDQTKDSVLRNDLFAIVQIEKAMMDLTNWIINQIKRSLNISDNESVQCLESLKASIEQSFPLPFTFSESCMASKNDLPHNITEMRSLLKSNNAEIIGKLDELRTSLAEIPLKTDLLCKEVFDVEKSDVDCWFGSIRGNYSRKLFNPVTVQLSDLSETKVEVACGKSRELLKNIEDGVHKIAIPKIEDKRHQSSDSTDFLFSTDGIEQIEHSRANGSTAESGNSAGRSSPTNYLIAITFAIVAVRL